MLEVELKYRNADRAATLAKLLQWGAQLVQDRTDVDIYFQAPDRDLKATDEAFRLRRIGSKNYLTYKGPKQDTETLADGENTAHDAEMLLEALGYKPVAMVRKKRQVYRLRRDHFEIEVNFDSVQDVGDFVELEILTYDEEYEAAKATLLATAAELGLTEKETRSYLGLVLANRKGYC
jgi:adenylate cyclase class 2